MTTMMTNGRVRKSLAEQLDRLDRTLDGLADGLNDAVAQAVKDAVGLAVQEAVAGVLREVLGNPELLTRLQGETRTAEAAALPTPTRAKKLGLGQRIKQAGGWIGCRLRMLGQACGQFLHGIAAVCKALRSGGQLRIEQLRECVTALRRRGQRALISCWQALCHLRHYTAAVTVALAVGGAVGVAAWWCGPWLASIAGGVGGFSTMVSVRRALNEWRAILS
jgi:hypothetical protein